MLAPQIETGAGDPLLQLGLAGRDHYAGLAAVLQETTGIDLSLWQRHARVARTEAERDQVRAEVAWQQEQGLRASG